MIPNKTTVRNFVELNPKLVSRKETDVPGVYLLKYKKRVFYDNLWNNILRECRGTLVDEDYNVIGRPFTKVFNQHENGTNFHRDDFCTAYQKVNGFMAAMSYRDGRSIISTTGSTDSKFADMATEMIEECDWVAMQKYIGHEKTIIMEIVHPGDPHIIPERVGVYYLGERWNTWLCGPNAILNEEHFSYVDRAKEFGMIPCDRIDAKFSTICDLAKTAKHEGYVVYKRNGLDALKIKSPYYLMAKFLARKNQEKLIKLINNPHEIKKIVDEEYYNLVDVICGDKTHFISLDEQGRLNYIREILEEQ